MYLSVTDIAVEVHSAVEELTVDMPEELASGTHSLFHLFTPSNHSTPESDLPFAEDWEDNSMIPSDSETGLAGSP